MLRDYIIFNVLTKPLYFILFIIFSLIFFFLYSYFQVFGLIDNISFWISTLNIYQLLFIALLSLLFGISFSYQIYLLRNPFCIVEKGKNNNMQHVGLTAFSFFSTFLVSTCPTCLTLAVFILPASILTMLSKYAWELNIVAITIILFALYKNKAFEKIEK